MLKAWRNGGKRRTKRRSSRGRPVIWQGGAGTRAIRPGTHGEQGIRPVGYCPARKIFSRGQRPVQRIRISLREPLERQVEEAFVTLKQSVLERQLADGSWRLCFEMGTMTDAFMVITLRALEIEDHDYIRRLCERMLRRQSPSGGWRLYEDEEEGNLDASAEAYAALRLSGIVHRTDERSLRAERFLRDKGGFRRVRGLLTKLMLAIAGAYPWPKSVPIPVEVILLCRPPFRSASSTSPASPGCILHQR
ncbi:hypothetical protein LJK87_32245 [Paenibacillus sp. P25]|nr:hypothetical protein LJK87_32245 [Paenibacillus sp. P25]